MKLLEYSIDEDEACFGIDLQIEFEDFFLEYEATEERIEECKNYLISTVLKTREAGEFEMMYDLTWDDFFCNVLCGQRKNCKEWKRKKEAGELGI